MGNKDPKSGITVPVFCPECGQIMIYRQVVKSGNFMTDEPMRYEALYHCPSQPVMMTVECSQKWGREQWYIQNPTSERAASESEE